MFTNIRRSTPASLGRSLQYWFLAIAIVPVVLVPCLNYLATSRSLVAAASAELVPSAHYQRQFITQFFHTHRAQVESLASAQVVRDYVFSHASKAARPIQERSRVALKAFLEQRYPETNEREQIYFFDALGRPLSDNFESSGLRLNQAVLNPNFERVLKRSLANAQIYFSDWLWSSRFPNKPVGLLIAPVFDGVGSLLGALAKYVHAQAIFDMLLHKATHTSRFYLLGKDGKLRSPTVKGAYQSLLSTGVSLKPRQRVSSWIDLLHSNVLRQTELPLRRFIGLGGVAAVGFTEPIALMGVNWTFVGELNYERILAPANLAWQYLPWLCLVMVLVAALFAHRQVRRITQPIDQLIAAADAAARGELAVRTDIHCGNELEQLGQQFNRSVSARQQVEAALASAMSAADEYLTQLNEQRYAIEQHAMVLVLNAEGRVCYANQKILDVSGYSETELVGLSHVALRGDEHSECFWQDLTDTLAKRQVWQAEICNKNKAGERLWLDSTVVPIMRAGHLHAYIAIYTDVTERKMAQTALLDAKNDAESGALAKSAFLASMGHEIRTPMNGILGMLNLLMKASLNPMQMRQAKLAHASAESLLAIINDVLDFSDIDTGKLKLELKDFNLIDTLCSLVSEPAQHAHEKNLEFVLDLSGVDRDYVVGDVVRLRQIILNLLGNAIKFTEQGEILFSASLHAVSNGQVRFEFSVMDSGVGISKAKQQSLFDSFVSLQKHSERDYGGSGVGLGISKKLCKLMGGDIEVRSQEGRGSSFSGYFYFNVSQLSRPVHRLLGEHDQDIKALVIADHKLNCSVLCKQLAQWGVQAKAINSIEQATQNLLRAQADPYLDSPTVGQEQTLHFDLAFIDLSLGREHSEPLYQAIQTYVKLANFKVVALLESSQSFIQKRLLHLGFNACLCKPVSPPDLFDCLQSVLMTGAWIKPTKKAEQPVNFQLVSSEHKPVFPMSTRILLVEDNAVNQAVASGLLERFGLNCTIANNGQEAIAALRSADSEQAFELVFLDCQMPVMDGYATARAIRAGEAGEHHLEVPIVAMTANALAGDRAECLAAGMTDYMAKPLNPDELQTQLLRHLPTSSGFSMLSLGERHSDTGAADALAEQQEMLPPLWDKDSALQNLGGDEALYSELLSAGIEDLDSNLARLQQAIAQQDLDLARISAHSIKGVAASLGAMRLSDAALDTELAARAQAAELLITSAGCLAQALANFKDRARSAS